MLGISFAVPSVQNGIISPSSAVSDPVLHDKGCYMHSKNRGGCLHSRGGEKKSLYELGHVEVLEVLAGPCSTKPLRQFRKGDCLQCVGYLFAPITTPFFVFFCFTWCDIYTSSPPLPAALQNYPLLLALHTVENKRLLLFPISHPCLKLLTHQTIVLAHQMKKK